MRMHDDRSNMQVFVGGELFDLDGWGPGGLGWELVEWNPGMEPWKDGGAWELGLSLVHGFFSCCVYGVLR